MIYPIVEYSHVIGKNTADFTPTDLVNFTKWWMKRPEKDIIMSKIKAQQTRAAKAGHKIQEEKKGATIMGNKKHNVASFQAAQRSRLTAKQIRELELGKEEVVEEEVGEDEVAEQERILAEEGIEGEEVVEEEMVVEEEVVVDEEVVAEEDSNVVATIGLTNEDIAALLWSINTVLAEYDFTENPMGEVLTALKEVLEGA